MSHRRFYRLIAALFVVLCLANLDFAEAQAPSASGGAASMNADGSEPKSQLTGTRKQIATIIFAGLAGGILGLSTLSFYGRPQDHLSNIAVGFAIGVIAGTAYTTYKAATRPYEAFDQADALNMPPVNSDSTRAPIREQIASRSAAWPLFAYQFNF